MNTYLYVCLVFVAVASCYKDAVVEANEELPYLPSVTNNHCFALEGTWVFSGPYTGRVVFDDCHAWFFIVNDVCPLLRKATANNKTKPVNKVQASAPKETAGQKALTGAKIFPNTECLECGWVHGFADGPFTGPDFQIESFHYSSFFCTLTTATEFECVTEDEVLYYDFVRRSTDTDYDLKKAIEYLNKQNGGSWWTSCSK